MVSGTWYMDKTLGTVRNCLFQEQELGISVENSVVKVEGNMFSKCRGVRVWRMSPKASIVSNIFNDCGLGILLNDGAQPLIKVNKLNQSRISVAASSSPNILENIFTGGQIFPGIDYGAGGSGICGRNSFINFQNPSRPPILIHSASQGGVGPRLLGNVFTDCVATNIPDQDYFGVSSSENEAEVNNSIGKKVKRGNIRLCVNCKKTGPCVLCKGCKGIYYCDEKCQTQDWRRHQKFCTSYSEAKNL